MSLKKPIGEIIDFEALFVSETEAGSGKWTVSLETIRTAALIDIAKSLRRIKALAECSNVAAGFRAMQKLASIEQGRERRRRKRIKR